MLYIKYYYYLCGVNQLKFKPMELQRTELKRILSGVNNPDMVSYTSLTKQDMNQYLDYWMMVDGHKKKNPNPTPNPYFENGIWKQSKMYKVVTGFNYPNSVNNRLKKEGKEPDFVGGYQNQIPMRDINGKVVLDEDKNPIMVDRLPWFEMISKGLVTDRKTQSKFYMRYQIQPDSEIGQPEFLFNGNPIMKQLFESYLTKSENHYDNQGLENPLLFLVCDLNNILTLSMGGEKYELVGTY